MKCEKMNIITIYRELNQYYCFHDLNKYWSVNDKDEIDNMLGFFVDIEFVKIQQIKDEVFFNNSIVTSFEDIALKIQDLIEFSTEKRMKPLLIERYKEFLTKYLQNKS